MSSKPQPPFPPQDLTEPGLESRMDPQPRYEADKYRPAGKLEGKAALVTGGDSGIGRAVAVMFAREGADVALVFLPEEESDAGRTRDEIETEGRQALLLPGDVTDPEFCRSAIDEVVKRFGKIDVLVNNAGVMLLGPLAEETDEAMRRMIEINLVGVILGTKLLMPRMRSRGRGQIVNIASQAGRYAPPGGATYAATKHAVIGLTEAARAELRGSGVEMIWVAPFVVNTALGAGAKQMRGMGLIDPETVAEAIVEAISTGRVEVWIPRRAKTIINSSLLLPRPVREFIGRVLGADRVLAAADSHLRSQYQESAGRQSELSR